MEKYIVLLSGGLDSVVNLYSAHKAGKVELALTFDYGQRAAANEIVAARYFTRLLNVPHKVIALEWLREITRTALVNQESDLPQLQNLDDMTEAGRSAKAVWVPNRNGVFLNVAASFAEALDVDYIVPGFNKEEAATFPDNSEEFIQASNKAFGLSTMSGVEVKCFTTQMTKKDLMKAARDLGIKLGELWSCYRSGTKPCGVCESCQRSHRALELL